MAIAKSDLLKGVSMKVEKQAREFAIEAAADRFSALIVEFEDQLPNSLRDWLNENEVKPVRELIVRISQAMFDYGVTHGAVLQQIALVARSRAGSKTVTKWETFQAAASIISGVQPGDEE